jgi:nitroreductase
MILNTFDTILTRRSIRLYKETPVPEAYFEKIIKAGMYAPSAMNLQPWDFIIMNTAESMKKCVSAVTHGESILRISPAAILVCGDNKLEQNLDYIIQNCSAAVQNILLQIHDMGLGACWIAVYPLAEIIKNLRDAFAIPQHIIPVALISVGYPAEEKSAEERYKTERIHFNKW